MAKKTTTRRKQNARKDSDRRAKDQPLDEQRWAGFGEVVPERRSKDRRNTAQGGNNRGRKSAGSQDRK